MVSWFQSSKPFGCAVDVLVMSLSKLVVSLMQSFNLFMFNFSLRARFTCVSGLTTEVSDTLFLFFFFFFFFWGGGCVCSDIHNYACCDAHVSTRQERHVAAKGLKGMFAFNTGLRISPWTRTAIRPPFLFTIKGPGGVNVDYRVCIARYFHHSR